MMYASDAYMFRVQITLKASELISFIFFVYANFPDSKFYLELINIMVFQELYHEMHALDRFEQDYSRKQQEDENPNAGQRGSFFSLPSMTFNNFIVLLQCADIIILCQQLLSLNPNVNN